MTSAEIQQMRRVLDQFACDAFLHETRGCNDIEQLKIMYCRERFKNAGIKNRPAYLEPELRCRKKKIHELLLETKAASAASEKAKVEANTQEYEQLFLRKMGEKNKIIKSQRERIEELTILLNKGSLSEFHCPICDCGKSEVHKVTYTCCKQELCKNCYESWHTGKQARTCIYCRSKC